MEWTVDSSWKNGHGSMMLPWLFSFTGGLLIAVCRPRLYFYPRNAEAFAPVPVNPLREPGDKGKKLQRLLDEEEII